MTDRPRERNALLLMDFQTSVVPTFGGDDRLLHRIAEMSEAARARDVDVVHVRVSLPRGLAEVGPANRVFTEVASSLVSGADTAVHPAIAPATQDYVVTKKRVSAFSGSDLDLLLRARRIDTLVLAGVSTSGALGCAEAVPDYGNSCSMRPIGVDRRQSIVDGLESVVDDGVSADASGAVLILFCYRRSALTGRARFVVCPVASGASRELLRARLPRHQFSSATTEMMGWMNPRSPEQRRECATAKFTIRVAGDTDVEESPE